MKKILRNTVIVSLFAAAGYLLFNAFNFEPVVNNNTLSLPDHRTCGTVENYNRMEKEYPEYRVNRELIEKQYEEYIKEHGKQQNPIVITIPVIVHVVYNTANQNISNDQILSQIDILNKDYRRLNSDTVNTPSPFKPLGADVQVQFCMARRDPNGNPTLGIRRVFTNNTIFGLDNAVKFTSQGGDDAWDRNRYLNIWVCNLGNNLLGYAEYPGGPAATDGVVILFTAYGTGGVSAAPYNLGRTATHEVGHWLNLIHIWGDDGGSCSGSDQVGDTPNQGAENYGCPSYPHLDACSSSSPGVMFMNYMDYTDDHCMNIFTLGQSSRMNSALSGPRSPILSSNGCTNVSGTPIAMFTSDSTSILYGGSVHFTDISAGIPISWNWTFVGGTPPSSNSQNPAISYTTPGYYPVKLRVTNSFGSDSVSISSYIKVRGASLSLFHLIAPPMFTRIHTSPTDPAMEYFIWTKSSTAPLIRYRMRIYSPGNNVEYWLQSNNNGTDTVLGLRRSMLDTMAAVFGTEGDSVVCPWQVYCNNGVDSTASAEFFVVTLVRNPIGIHQISSGIPSKFALFNNYPNPFNPSTNIRFDVAKAGNVRIVVYDMLGRTVVELVNSTLQPGSYNVDWNAANTSSGVYYYKMESESFTEVKKMVLVK